MFVTQSSSVNGCVPFMYVEPLLTGAAFMRTAVCVAAPCGRRIASVVVSNFV